MNAPSTRKKGGLVLNKSLFVDFLSPIPQVHPTLEGLASLISEHMTILLP